MNALKLHNKSLHRNTKSWWIEFKGYLCPVSLVVSLLEFSVRAAD